MRYLKGNRGMALIMALILITIAAFFTTALFAYSSTDALQLKYNQDLKQADYLARTAIESVTSAYEKLDDTMKLTGTQTMTTTYVFLLNDGSFYTYDKYTAGETSNIPADNNIKGYYIVEMKAGINQNLNGTVIEDTIEFNATAVSGGITTLDVSTGIPINDGGVKTTASAFFIPSSSTASLKLYDPDTGVAYVSNPPLTKNASKITVDTLFGKGKTYDLWSFSQPAALIVNQINPSQPKVFKLPDNNTINKVTYGAPIVCFNMPVDLTPSSNDKQAVLLLVGNDIIINGDIELFAYKSLLFNRVGTLVITPPDGYTKGRIYFNADVYVTIRSIFGGNKRSLAFSKGTAYEFKQYSVDGSNKGIDLMKYAVDNNLAELGVYATFLNNLYGNKYNYEETSTKKYMIQLDLTKPINQQPNADSVNYLFWK
jgi:hypothetical protein